jgi:hypothetical protein
MLQAAADPRDAMLQAAADQFLRYEKHHIEKGTPDSNAKAAANHYMAAECLRAIGVAAPPPLTPSVATIGDLYRVIADSIGVDVEQVREDMERPLGKDQVFAAPYGKADSDMVDVTEVPGLPPHRFTLFEKSKHWAYGRGLEINPSHIPTMLDRMQEDGYYLQAVFGGIEPTKVGMIFRRSSTMTFFRQSAGQLGEVSVGKNACATCEVEFPADGRDCHMCYGE